MKDKQFLMHRQTLAYVLNTEANRAVFGTAGIPITFEQAKSLDGENRDEAAAKILREVVAADNAAALKAVEAKLGVPEPPPVPAPEAPAEPAEVPLKDLPLAELREMAKRDGGFPDGKDVDKASRRELVALLQP